MSVKLKIMAGAFLATVLGTAANATVLTFDSVTTGAEAPGVWYTDRYAPAGFGTANFLGDNRLALTLAATDHQSSLFYDTQGRGYDVASGTQYLSVQLYVTQAMITDPNRVTGIWGQAADPNNTPVIELAAGYFRGWDAVNGDWTNLTAAAVASQWYTMAIDHTAGQFNYYINGVFLGSSGDSGAADLVHVILEGENGLVPGVSASTDAGSGTNATYYYDNLTYAAAAPTPLPGALPLFASGLGALGLLAARRRKRKALVATAA